MRARARLAGKRSFKCTFQVIDDYNTAVGLSNSDKPEDRTRGEAMSFLVKAADKNKAIDSIAKIMGLNVADPIAVNNGIIINIIQPK